MHTHHRICVSYSQKQVLTRSEIVPWMDYGVLLNALMRFNGYHAQAKKRKG